MSDAIRDCFKDCRQTHQRKKRMVTDFGVRSQGQKIVCVCAKVYKLRNVRAESAIDSNRSGAWERLFKVVKVKIVVVEIMEVSE